MCVHAHTLVRQWQTDTHSEDLPWPQCRQWSSVNSDRLCFLGETIICLFSLFCLFPLVPFLFAPPPLHSFSRVHPSLHNTPSPGWPSVTSTRCPAWPSPSGWLWCLAHQRRTSSAASSWGSCPHWWSRPPRTSWVSALTLIYFSNNAKNVAWMSSCGSNIRLKY